MGRGNCCTFNEAEGLYYVDNDFLDVYKRKDCESDEPEDMFITPRDDGFDFDMCEWDECESYFRRHDFEYEFTEKMLERFKSLERVDKWISRDRRALLENSLFYIVCEDNEWSLAIELIQKEDKWGGNELVGLQMGHYRRYLDAIRDILLDMHGEVGTYDGAWTHGVLKKGA